MEINNRQQLKQYFESGKRPTQSNFGDLIDSVALVSEIPQIPTKSYKIFSALLRIENISLNPNKPIYVANYTLLEPNTIGELNILLHHNQIRITAVDDDPILTFERRFVTIGTLRLDHNFDNVFESDDTNDTYIDFIFNMKLDDNGGTSVPMPIEGPPIFYNLPIEIRIYDEPNQSAQSPEEIRTTLSSDSKERNP